MGRPAKYTLKVFDELCEQIAEGKSLNKVCEQEAMPTKKTFYKWMRERLELVPQYARAREEQADSYVDEIRDIADTEPDVQRAKVKIDAIKWIACKLHPRNYGDKQEISTREILPVSIPQRPTKEEWLAEQNNS